MSTNVYFLFPTDIYKNVFVLGTKKPIKFPTKCQRYSPFVCRRTASRRYSPFRKEKSIVLKSNSYQYVDKLRVVFNVKFTIFFHFYEEYFKKFVFFQLQKKTFQIFFVQHFFSDIVGSILYFNFYQSKNEKKNCKRAF